MKNFYMYSTNRQDVNFKDGDQTKYAPPTPLQSAVSTARYSWNNLSFSSVQSRLDTVGAAAAEKWALLVTGLRPQAAGGISSPVPKAPKKPVDDFDDCEPKGNIDDDGWLHDCRSNEGATTGIKYPKNKVDKEPYKDKVHKIYNLHNQSLHEHNLELRIQGEAGPRFQQEEQKYDPLGVSKAWQRGAKQEESIKRKQKLLAQWRGKEEKGPYQKDLGTRADTGLPSSALCKKTLSTKKKEDTNQRMKTHGCAHTGVYQAEKGRNSAAGMQRNAQVTISLPRSKQVTVPRSSTKRRAGRSVYTIVQPLYMLGYANLHVQSSLFYGLCAQVRAAPRSREDTVELIRRIEVGKWILSACGSAIRDFFI